MEKDRSMLEVSPCNQLCVDAAFGGQPEHPQRQTSYRESPHRGFSSSWAATRTPDRQPRPPGGGTARWTAATTAC